MKDEFIELLESWQWAQHRADKEYLQNIEDELLVKYGVDMTIDWENILKEYGLI